MTKEPFQWSMIRRPDVEERRRVLLAALIVEVQTRGLDRLATPSLRTSAVHWSSRGPVKLLLSVGFYPDQLKTFREPKRGFNIPLIVDAAQIAWDRRQERIRKAREEKDAVDANYDAMRRIEDAGLIPAGVKVGFDPTGLYLKIVDLTEEEARALLEMLTKLAWRA